MPVPSHCTVLVVGGGPGGSYAATVLAREGVDVVVLEADVFPRYHIGESMIASMRYFLRFIDFEKTFENYGFTKKYGATFKINDKREAYTDFTASLGPGGHAWNVIRSQADDLLFRYAAKCGAQTFEATKVTHVDFEPYADPDFNDEVKLANPGRPASATWSRKDGSSGTITCDYLVDASGRAGLISTKYLKNRKLNEGLKNIANWGYWKNAGRFGVGTKKENSPFFEALKDGSGWCWAIPLHDDTLSVGLVMRQDLFFGKKKDMGSPPTMEVYKNLLDLVPRIGGLLADAEIISDIKTASDWSYSASAYAGPHFRVVGDAGCFIDPYFSSGVHLALASGLSAATTIQASRKGDCSELSAAKWHSSKVAKGYTRFLLIVMTILRQLRKQNQSVLGDEKEDGFDSAFGFIQPVIQGTADADTSDATQNKAAAGVGFALSKLQQQQPTAAQQSAVVDKIQNAGQDMGELEKLTEDEIHILHHIAGKQLVLTKGAQGLDNISNDVVDGWKPRIEHGNLGLEKAETVETGTEKQNENGSVERNGDAEKKLTSDSSTVDHSLAVDVH